MYLVEALKRVVPDLDWTAVPNLFDFATLVVPDISGLAIIFKAYQLGAQVTH